MDYKYENLGKCLRELREGMQLSQADLAKHTGLNVAAISHWETGRRVPTIQNLCVLADYFNLSLDIVIGRKQVDGYPY